MAKKKSRRQRKSAPQNVPSAPQPTPNDTPTPPPPVSTDVVGFRSWPMWILLVLMLFGIGAGVYMTQHHEVQLYGDAESQTELIGCVESEKVSCDLVNTSEWSEVLGVPQFTLAIPTYALLAFLSVVAARGRWQVLPLILALGLFNTAYSVFLGYISVVELGKVCTWCMRLYVINLATPILAGIAGAHRAPRPSRQDLISAGAVMALGSILAIGGQKAYRAQLLDGAPDIALPTTTVTETRKDATGDCPVLEWEVQTEDGNKAILVTEPDDAWKGNPDATVAVVEFADLECGYCKRASGQLKRLYEAYGDRVLFVFKHFPMDPACNPGVNNPKHRYACRAAEAAVCAQDQGLFWPFHDLSFKNQHKLKPDNLRTYAEAAGADVAAFDACMKSGNGRARVRGDALAGKAVDTHGTPRIWVAGKLYRSGSSAEQMARQIEIALGADAANAARAAQAMREVREAPKPIPDDVAPMQSIAYGDLSFQMDTFEAGIADGVATVGKHQIPANGMSWFAARDACEAAGKRLCTEEEWVSACQGAPAVDDNGDGAFADDMVEGTTYPYSDYHNPRACWDAKKRDAFRPVYTGEMPACVSRDGVYDLTGNMEEWVGTTPETAVLIGGAFDTSKDFARCYRRNDTFGPGLANIRTGFRCCQ